MNPAAILQFDRFEPSTQLRPIDFPQFTSIDSIDHWTVWRLGCVTVCKPGGTT